MHKQGEEKILTVEWQLINAEGMTKLEKPFGSCHGNNQFRQETVDARTSG